MKIANKKYARKMPLLPAFVFIYSTLTSLSFAGGFPCPWSHGACQGAGDTCAQNGSKCDAIHDGNGAAPQDTLRCPTYTGTYNVAAGTKCGKRYARPSNFDPEKAKAMGSNCYNPSGNCGEDSHPFCG